MRRGVKIFALMFLLDFWRLIVRPRTVIQFLSSLFFFPVILFMLLISNDYQNAIIPHAMQVAFGTAAFLSHPCFPPPPKGFTFWLYRKLREEDRR